MPPDSTSCAVVGFGVLHLCVLHLRLSAEHTALQFGHVHHILRKILNAERVDVEPWCSSREQAFSLVNASRLVEVSWRCDAREENWKVALPLATNRTTQRNHQRVPSNALVTTSEERVIEEIDLRETLPPRSTVVCL